MKKNFFYATLLTALFVFSACNLYPADSIGTFPSADYSTLITTDSYKISSSTKTLPVLNLFYDTFGYGEFDVSGTATHTESAVVMGETITKTISCDIKKVKISHIDNSTPGLTLDTYYIDFYNTDNEVLSYCYEWQYHNTNAWKNNKTCNFFQASDWYKTATPEQRIDWNLIIVR